MIKTLFTISAIVSALPSQARRSYYNNFKDFHENIGIDTSEVTNQLRCGVCHVSKRGGGPRNDYGADFRKSGRDFSRLLLLDSDGDNFSNIELVAWEGFSNNATCSDDILKDFFECFDDLLVHGGGM